MQRYSHLGGEEIPDDFDSDYGLEEECPCGCKIYKPSTLNICEGFKPMNIEVCQFCGRARMEVARWTKIKG